MTAPILTSSPAGAEIWRVPAASAWSSVETLSVSMVTRRSPTLTESPLFLCHVEMTALVMDSPALGTLISKAMMGRGKDERGGRGRWPLEITRELMR